MTPPLLIAIGHTAQSPGAASPDGGAREWQYNEDIALWLQDQMPEIGVHYRDTYRLLPTEINAKNPRAVVELHFNSVANPQAHGTETLYWHTSAQGKRLAEVFQRHMVDALGLRDRGLVAIKSESERGGWYLKKTNMPAIIVEPGFISNLNDRRALLERKLLLAQAYKKAIQEYINLITQ